jgi:hypothetical protein
MMFVPTYELSDVRVLTGNQLAERDLFAVTSVLCGVEREALRKRMHERGWRFSNKEYTHWREAARRIVSSAS